MSMLIMLIWTRVRVIVTKHYLRAMWTFYNGSEFVVNYAIVNF